MKTLSTRAGILFSIGLFVILSLSCGQSFANTNKSAPIKYSTVQHISSSDSSAVIAEKAAKVLPRPNQTAWMRLERTFFIHFGPNTFRGVEWGDGREDPSIFNPTELDADQWIRAVKDGGGKIPAFVADPAYAAAAMQLPPEESLATPSGGAIARIQPLSGAPGLLSATLQMSAT